ncbi:hypothetical protein [Nocardioides allogilvus]|uniref:hypothetical protein n=1 Tax=Nocardioides allogilvus TaxID=2072017 RepID=UPI000D31D666|nr:hypothetical protein [Nocardioides allogilvus]
MVWNPFGKARDRELEALDRWRTARKLAGADLTDLEEQLAGEPAGHAASHHHSSALEIHERAREALRSSTTAEDVFTVEPLLVDARYHLAAARALSAGEPVPERREPCFFDPCHGPSTTDELWSPPVGDSRRVSVCSLDAERLSTGTEPLTRMIRVGDRYVPVHEVGGYRGVLEHHHSLFQDEAASHNGKKGIGSRHVRRPGRSLGQSHSLGINDSARFGD